jgi:hypothetical protein
MGLKNFINKYRLLIFICIQYFYNYLRKESNYDNWNNKECFHENNPILKLYKNRPLIVEPINFFSTFTILLSNGLYKNIGNSKIHQFHQNALYLLLIGTLFQHGSCTQYGIDVDYLGMIAYFISLILKDLFILKKVSSNTFYVADIIFQIILLLISIPQYRRIHEEKPKYRIKWGRIFRIMVGLKITSEIKKHLNDKQFMLGNLLFLAIYIAGKKEPVKKFKKQVNKLIENKYNIFNIFNTLIRLPYLFSLLFSFWIKNKKKPKQLHEIKTFMIGILCISVAFLFQEKNEWALEYERLPKENAILQFHALWHILAFLGLYYLDKYALVNIKNII